MEQKYRMFHADKRIFHIEKHTDKNIFSTNECVVIDTLSNLHIVATALNIDPSPLFAYENMLQSTNNTNV